jgi:hypothetical protein
MGKSNADILQLQKLVTPTTLLSIALDATKKPEYDIDIEHGSNSKASSL